MIRATFILLLIISIQWGCKDEAGTPKPRAYPRVEYPEREYVKYNDEKCPYTFEYPSYAEVNPKDQECWFDLYMPMFEARIHCSYHPIESREHFDDMVDDVFKIARRINERASYMEEMRIRTNHGVHGLALEWSGAAASPVHFFLSDTTEHFFKGALYFDSKVKPDSLAPISDFIRKDVNRLLASFEWKE